MVPGGHEELQGVQCGRLFMRKLCISYKAEHRRSRHKQLHKDRCGSSEPEEIVREGAGPYNSDVMIMGRYYCKGLGG